MPSKASTASHDLTLDPNEIFRPKHAERYFGLRHSQIALKVKSGEIPAPIKLSASGHAVGWLGSQIIEYHKTRLHTHESKRLKEKARPAQAVTWPSSFLGQTKPGAGAPRKLIKQMSLKRTARRRQTPHRRSHDKPQSPSPVVTALLRTFATVSEPTLKANLPRVISELSRGRR
jgi:predicted DNA-binding transcriptional regulator AlpA